MYSFNGIIEAEDNLLSAVLLNSVCSVWNFTSILSQMTQAVLNSSQNAEQLCYKCVVIKDGCLGFLCTWPVPSYGQYNTSLFVSI